MLKIDTALGAVLASGVPGGPPGGGVLGGDEL